MMSKISDHLLSLARHTRLLILDVDGVLTDGRIWLSATGEALKPFHVHDGLGIKQVLKHPNLMVAILSSRQCDIVTDRMQELGVSLIFQGKTNKQETVEKLLFELNLTWKNIAYVGDDLPDLPVMKQLLSKGGLPIAVANAREPIKKIAQWITSAHGGHGAVRDVCDMLLYVQEQQEALNNKKL